jgi:hypothetical protein
MHSRSGWLLALFANAAVLYDRRQRRPSNHGIPVLRNAAFELIESLSINPSRAPFTLVACILMTTFRRVAGNAPCSHGHDGTQGRLCFWVFVQCRPDLLTIVRAGYFSAFRIYRTNCNSRLYERPFSSVVEHLLRKQ